MGQEFSDAGVSDAERGIGTAPAVVPQKPQTEPDTSEASGLTFDSDFGEAFEEVREKQAAEFRQDLKSASNQKRLAKLVTLNPRNLLAESIKEADAILEKAIVAMKGLSADEEFSTCASSAFNSRFATSSVEEFRSAQAAVIDVFTKIKEGDLSIKSSSVTYYDDGLMCGDFVGGYTPKYSDKQCIICPYCWEELVESIRDDGSYDLSVLTETVIHEAVHRLGGFTYVDHAYEGLDSLSLAKALTNAHSYATCAVRLSKC